MVLGLEGEGTVMSRPVEMLLLLGRVVAELGWNQILGRAPGDCSTSCPNGKKKQPTVPSSANNSSDDDQIKGKRQHNLAKVS